MLTHAILPSSESEEPHIIDALMEQTTSPDDGLDFFGSGSSDSLASELHEQWVNLTIPGLSWYMSRITYGDLHAIWILSEVITRPVLSSNRETPSTPFANAINLDVHSSPPNLGNDTARRESHPSATISLSFGLMQGP